MPEITTLARPYAKAIFESAIEKNELKAGSKALTKLAMIANNKEMQPVLTNPLMSKKELASLFIDLAGDSLNEASKQLIMLLAEKKRLSLLPSISLLFQALLAEHERTIEVKVVSAYPIDQSRMQRLQYALQNNLKREVTIRCVIDRALLGGVIIYAGDQVIDGSLRSKLNRLSERLCI